MTNSKFPIPKTHPSGYCTRARTEACADWGGWRDSERGNRGCVPCGGVGGSAPISSTPPVPIPRGRGAAPAVRRRRPRHRTRHPAPRGSRHEQAQRRRRSDLVTVLVLGLGGAESGWAGGAIRQDDAAPRRPKIPRVCGAWADWLLHLFQTHSNPKHFSSG